MTKDWEEIDHDPVTGRRIFKRDIEPYGRADGGTYDFSVAAEFEVRNRAGEVIHRNSGSAKGEYWCGVFLWFVKDKNEIKNGLRLRLDQSDKDDAFFDLPTDAPPL